MPAVARTCCAPAPGLGRTVWLDSWLVPISAWSVEPPEGLEQPAASGGRAGPVLATARTARPSLAAVLISTFPPATLWRTALPTRLATSRSASSLSRSRGAGLVTASRDRPWRAASGRAESRISPVIAGQVDQLALAEAALA